jgi:hypothetical protein
MGDTRVSGIRSSTGDTIPSNEPCEPHLPEVNRPDPIVDLFEPNVVGVEGGDEIQPAVLKANSPSTGYALDQKVVWVFERRQRRWVGAW